MRGRIRIRLASWRAKPLSFFTSCMRWLEVPMEGPDPVVLSVSQIRQRTFEVTREVTSAGTVEDTAVPTGSAAGRLFHLCAASVVDRRSGTHWEQVLGEEDNAIRLADAVYDIVLGPELVRCRSAVTGEQLLLVWNAVRAFSVWFAKLIERARQRGVIRFDPKREVWEGSTELFVGEFEVIQQFHEAGWRAP